jgi:hypothetical protein
MIRQFPETVTLQKPRNALDSVDLIRPDLAGIILLKEPL